MFIERNKINSPTYKMRLNHFKLTGTCILLHLFCTCLCTTTFKNYRLNSTATLMSDAFQTYSKMDKMRCFAECAQTIRCNYVSYDEIHTGCMLSSLTAAGGIAANGWSLFQLEPRPENGDYFNVGSYAIATSSQKVTKAEAESLCASSGFGRLVEIRSEPMYLAVSDYLKSMPQAMKDLYADVWMAGVYDGSDYRFPDGSLLPITAANDADTNGSPCMRINPLESYKYDDTACDNLNSYICELV